MFYTTFKDYKENYNTTLDSYLSEYEDNRASFFLEKELAKYKDYYDALSEFKEDLSIFKSKERVLTLFAHTRITPYNRDLTPKLERNYRNVYNTIVTETDNTKTGSSFINIDLDKLQNHINSAKLILDFIDDKIEGITFSSKNRPNNKLSKSNMDKPKKLSEKWHALHYLLEQKSIGSKLPTNREGNFIKSELEKIGKERSEKTGQGFYRQVQKYAEAIDNAASIERSFGKDWKEHVIELSNNDAVFVKFLEDNY